MVIKMEFGYEDEYMSCAAIFINFKVSLISGYMERPSLLGNCVYR